MLLTDTDGLYTADPRLDPDAELVAEVDGLRGARARSQIGARDLAAGLGRDALEGRGGGDGDRGGHPGGDRQRPCARTALAAALAGEPAGTRFRPQPARYSSFKLWLKYAKPAHGHVAVDAGAARALREGGTACCRSGSSTSRASFDAGDAVEVRATAAAAPIGKGIVQLLGGRAAPRRWA